MWRAVRIGLTAPSDAQFSPAAARLAEIAAREAQRISQTFSSLKVTADVLLSEVRRISTPGNQYPG